MAIDPEAKRILDKRLASGEIGKEEYRELLSELRGEETQFHEPEDSRVAQSSRERISNPEPELSQKKKSDRRIKRTEYREWDLFIKKLSSYIVGFFGILLVAILMYNCSGPETSSSVQESYPEAPRLLSDVEINDEAERIYTDMRLDFRSWERADNEYDRKAYSNDITEKFRDIWSNYTSEDWSKIQKKIYSLSAIDSN